VVTSTLGDVHMRASTIVGLLGASAWLVACTSDPGQNDDAETGVPVTTGPGSSSGADSATSIEPPGTTTAPADGTTTSMPGSTDDAATDTDPDVYFDLGIIPDSPGGKIPGCQSAIDIVFVMDVSTTMGEFLGLMADEMLAVDAAIGALELPNPPHYGLAVFVDDAELLNGGAPYPDATALRDDFIMWSNFTATNQQVGGGNPNFTWTENSLDGLYLAATEFDWRPAETTTRIVIHTTDDTFWDGPTLGNGVMIQHGYAETVQALQDATVRVYSFADDIGGSCECQDVTPGWSTPYMGMLPVPEATDGGVYAINEILAGTVSLADAINTAVEESYCDPYEPQG
jgi:hypothetical protein